MSRPNKRLQEIHAKEWKDVTEKDIDEIYRTKCRKCKYRGIMRSKYCCDYILIEGHSRGCRPDFCTHFKKGERQKTTVRPTISGRAAKVGGYARGTYPKPSGTYFGLIVENYLQMHDMRQRDLANAIGVKGPAISNWRRLKDVPSDDNLQALCDFIGITVDTAKKAMERGYIE